MSDSQPNEVPEFANTDEATRRREIAAAGPRPNEHLDRIRRSLGMPTLVGVGTEAEAFADSPEPVSIRLLTAPGQRIIKRVLALSNEGGVSQRTRYDFGIQFTGYSGYCMSFEKDPGRTNMFGKFFRDVASFGVNLNRAMLFLKESYANTEHPENCHRLLLDGDPTNTRVNPQYLDNLDRYVAAAKGRGVVVQICLFMHHAVAGSNECDMPRPVVLSGTPHQRYKTFLNTASVYRPTQENFIDAVVTRLRRHWNVIYEIGNELRVPQPNDNYNDNHLRGWIEWVAQRIRANDSFHLIGTSTGSANESLINSIALLQYCAFHQEQWTEDIAAACARAGSYGDKHLIADDDGGSRELQRVRTWVRAALDVGGGCRGSFNHKGPTMQNQYDPNWLDQHIEGRHADSPCARAA